MKRLLTIALVLVGLSSPALASAQVRDVEFGPQAVETYGRRWAVIVGINYQGATGPKLELQAAENDARALQRLLIAHYGFTDKTVTYVPGAAAKRNQLGKLLQTFRTQAKEEDCVLFFFAGHASFRKPEAAGGYLGGLLYPADVEFSLESRNPETGTPAARNKGSGLLS